MINYYRGGPLLPFLAGVLVTTPFVFLNNNKNQRNAYPPIYPPYQYYPPYQMFGYPFYNQFMY